MRYRLIRGDLLIHSVYAKYAFEEADKIDSDLAVKFHGAAMQFISPHNAQLLHNGKSHPISLYTTVNENIITLNAFSLTDEMYDFVDYFDKCTAIEIFGATKPAVKIHSEIKDVSFPEYLKSVTGDIVKLNFVTPAMFKQNHKPCYIPCPERYFSSVIAKLNEFENASIKSVDFILAWNSSRVIDYNLTSEKFNVTGLMLKGMLGNITIMPPIKSDQLQLLKTVLAYAQFSGVGAKTAQGMGGFKVFFK